MTGGEYERELPDLRPRPDPTTLTTAQLAQAITSTRELFDSKMEALANEMAGHWALDIERFKSVDHQLRQAEAVRLEQKADTIKATNDTMAVIHQENTRIETNTLQQIAAERATSKAEWQGLTDRVTMLERQGAAALATKQGGNEGRAALYAGLAAFVSILSAIGLVVAVLTKL